MHERASMGRRARSFASDVSAHTVRQRLVVVHGGRVLVNLVEGVGAIAVVEEIKTQAAWLLARPFHVLRARARPR